MTKFVSLPMIDQFASECRQNAIETVRRSVLYAREDAKEEGRGRRQAADGDGATGYG